MLFYIVWLSHHYEFEVQHALSNQSFFRLSLDHHHALPGAYLGCGVIIYFISASVAVVSRFGAATKKEDNAFSWGNGYRFSHQKFTKFPETTPQLPSPWPISFFFLCPHHDLLKTWSSSYIIKEVGNSEGFCSHLIIEESILVRWKIKLNFFYTSLLQLNHSMESSK